MTKNNYPEGLDELAIAVAKEEGKNYVQGWIPQSHFNYYARALLDAVAEGGYMLVDAKKQEPVAWMHKEDKDYVCGNGIKRVCSEGYKDYSIPLYTHPAIPGRVALPEGDGSLRRDAERYRWLRDSNGSYHVDAWTVTDKHDLWVGEDLDAAIDSAMEASNGNA